MNAFATTVLRALVDPGCTGTEIDWVRARLAEAGLLAAPQVSPSDPT